MSESTGTQPAPRPQRAQVNGAAVTASVAEAGLDIDGRLIDWVDIDGAVEGDHRVRLDLADGTSITLSMLGATHDRFMLELRTARRRARFAALTIATGDPLVSYLSRADSGLVDIHLYAKAVVAEPREGHPVSVPLSLIGSVERSGYEITIAARGTDPLVVRALGVKTDEFIERLAVARRDLQAATAAAYAGFDEALAGFTAPDGWAMTAQTAGTHWSALLARAQAGSRSEQVRELLRRSGDRLGVGIFTDGGGTPLPFVLAPIGGRVVVEATDGDDRATFVFTTEDVARLNAVLVLTSFRREAIFLPDAQLGRWAVAARVWPAVREARAALTARIVHDDRWAEHLGAALA